MPINIDHIHKGSRDNREVTHVSLIEFRSNGEREKALDILAKISAEDSLKGKLAIKRARTALQKQRNDVLIKACDLIKEKTCPGQDVKIDWKNRKVTCQGNDGFIQMRDSTEGSFHGSFQALHL